MYLSGTPQQLIDDAGLVIERRPRRALLKDALLVLLTNQFVVSEHVPGHNYRCNFGSGEGLLHSGNVANVCYLIRAELQ